MAHMGAPQGASGSFAARQQCKGPARELQATRRANCPHLSQQCAGQPVGRATHRSRGRAGDAPQCRTSVLHVLLPADQCKLGALQLPAKVVGMLQVGAGLEAVVLFQNLHLRMSPMDSRGTLAGGWRSWAAQSQAGSQGNC